MTAFGPLAGFRIVEFAGIGPVPLAGMMLADLGADVVVIERPVVTGVAAWLPARFRLTNRGKRLVPADLKIAADRDAVLGLVNRADALIEGFRPGTMERLGFGPDGLLRSNPRLVFCRVTGWGQTGPRAATAGHDISYLAVTGALAAIGRRDGPPVPPVNFLGDYAGGTMFAVTGILAALLHAGRSGCGQVVDAAMIDGVGALLAPMQALVAGGKWQLTRAANLIDGGAPFYDVYQTGDGQFVAVGAIEDEFFAALAERLALDPELVARRWEVAAWPELRTVLAARFRAEPRAHWVALFAGTDACVAPVLDLSEARLDPHHRARHSFVEVDGMTHPAPAPRFAATPARPPMAPPIAPTTLGQLLGEWGER